MVVLVGAEAVGRQRAAAVPASRHPPQQTSTCLQSWARQWSLANSSALRDATVLSCVCTCARAAVGLAAGAWSEHDLRELRQLRPRRQTQPRRGHACRQLARAPRLEHLHRVHREIEVPSGTCTQTLHTLMEPWPMHM